MHEPDRRRVLAAGIAAMATLANGARAQATVFVCPPCGCAMDGVLFPQAGTCPACGMALVAFDPKAALRHPGPPDYDECMRQHVEANKFSGAVLVARGAEVLFSMAYGPAQAEWDVSCTPATKFRLGSLTKPFTATAILQLAADGKLGLDDPISRHLKNCPAAWQAVTISELLNHTSGIPDYMNLQSFWKDFLMLKSQAQMVASFSGAPLDFAPGSRFSYSNSGYYVLGMIIENVAQRSYEDVLRDRIFGPLGMSDTGYDHADPIIPKRAAGYRLGNKGELLNALYIDMNQPFADGGLYSTTGDLLTFARSFDGAKLLPSRYRTLMATPGKGSYGYGWFIVPAPHHHAGQEVCHSGGINGFAAWLSWLPEEGSVVAVLSNLQDTNARQVSLDLYSVLHHESYEAPATSL